MNHKMRGEKLCCCLERANRPRSLGASGMQNNNYAKRRIFTWRASCSLLSSPKLPWVVKYCIFLFCSRKKDLVKEVKQYITLDCFLSDPSTLSCTAVYMLYVCFCEHTKANFSAFQWDFHKLSQSWAPGSAGWRALLKALLKLVYFCGSGETV